MVTSVQFLDRSDGWATAVDFNPKASGTPGFESLLLHTTDGGGDWHAVSDLPGNEFFQRVHFSDSTRGWLYTHAGLYRSEDRGATWHIALGCPLPTYRLD
jgi:photosystem II stability/assembly factor-like uncharacterized protein